MNCKPGDLAIVVRARTTKGLVGRIVRVIRPAVPGELFERAVDGPNKTQYCGTRQAWVCTSEGSPLPWFVVSSGITRQMKERPIGDELLRPIRPADGEDEMLRIAGKPQDAREKA